MTARHLQDFAGDWDFSRDIFHDNGTTARVLGTARFDPSDDGLTYVETGQMALNGTSLTTTRRYLWREGLDIHFEDGRFFHTVPALGGSARHWCDPDQYDVDYEFADWPVWRSTWHVSGPRKAYRMISEYARMPG